MKRKSIITVLALVLVLTLSLSIFSACNKKHKYSSEWKFDEKTHWHECTTKKHTDTSEKLPHEFKEEIVKAADYGVVGEKKFTCKDCGYSYTEDINALGAKDNEIVLVAGKTLGKEYDGEVISITKDDFVIDGNRAPTIMFKVKGADDNTYTATAPKKVGEYTVKVSVRATAEWKATSKTFDFAIAKKVLTATGTKEYDGNATMSATLTGVVEGETVTATITMDSKNVGATVQEVELGGVYKDNYVIDKANVVASITKKEISSIYVSRPYSGETEFGAGFGSSFIVAGDNIRAIITMESKNAGANVQSVKLVGEDADNYTVNIKNVKATITPREIKIKDLEVEYNGGRNFLLVNQTVSREDVAKYNLVAGDNLYMTLVFKGPKANAGNTQEDLERITLSGTDENNYKKPELSDVTVNVIKRKLTLKDKTFTISKEGAGNISSVRVTLTEDDGILSGADVGVRVKPEALDNAWLAGNTYPLTNAASVMTTGDNRDDYEVAALENCKVVIQGKTVTLNATYVDSSGNPISGIEGNFSVTIDAKGISAQTAQGDLSEYLMKGENKNKNVEVTMEVIDGSVTIAAFSRVGVNTQSDLRYVCNYGSFEVSGDQPTFIEFALFNYNTKYIDENGTWIYTDTTTLNVRIKIRFYDIATLDKNTPAIDAIGANYTAVFETTVDSGEYGSVCTLDLEWTSEKITGSEVIVYNALTGSEINFNKVNDKQYTFDAIAGNTKFYVYVEGVGGDNQVTLKVTLTCALNEGTPTRLEFSEGVNEISSGELSYAAGEEKRFVVSVGSGVTFGMKYTISNIPEGATIKVYRDNGTEVTLSTDNSFELLAGVSVRDYTIVITNTTDSNLNINFSIKREQTSGTIVVS